MFIKKILLQYKNLLILLFIMLKNDKIENHIFEELKWDFTEKDSLDGYDYIGKATGKDSLLENVFKFWEKDDEFFCEVLNDKEPDYFIKIDSKNDLYNIEKTYTSKDDVPILGEDTLLNFNNKNVERAKNYTLYDPDIDEQECVSFFMGVIDDLGKFESSLILYDTVHVAPVRLSSGEYAPKDEFPKFSVYKSALSKCFIEIFFFDNITDKDGNFPVFGRVLVNDKENIPVDLQKFIKQNNKLDIDDYVEFIHDKVCDDDNRMYVHNVQVLEFFCNHKVDEYIDRCNPSDEKIKTLLSNFKTEIKDNSNKMSDN